MRSIGMAHVRIWRASVLRRRVLLVVDALVLVLAAGAQATTPYGRHAKARAERDAAKELAAVRLPPRFQERP